MPRPYCSRCNPYAACLEAAWLEQTGSAGAAIDRAKRQCLMLLRTGPGVAWHPALSPGCPRVQALEPPQHAHWRCKPAHHQPTTRKGPVPSDSVAAGAKRLRVTRSLPPRDCRMQCRKASTGQRNECTVPDGAPAAPRGSRGQRRNLGQHEMAQANTGTLAALLVSRVHNRAPTCKACAQCTQLCPRYGVPAFVCSEALFLWYATSLRTKMANNPCLTWWGPCMRSGHVVKLESGAGRGQARRREASPTSRIEHWPRQTHADPGMHHALHRSAYKLLPPRRTRQPPNGMPRAGVRGVVQAAVVFGCTLRHLQRGANRVAGVPPR
jgi:hypothetical protein